MANYIAPRPRLTFFEMLFFPWYLCYVISMALMIIFGWSVLLVLIASFVIGYFDIDINGTNH